MAVASPAERVRDCMRSVVYGRPPILPPNGARALLWTARVVWAALPFTAGAACTDAIAGWSDGTAAVAAVLLWLAWTAGLVALLSPRPWGFTVLRVTGTAAVVTALAAAPGRTGATAALAIVGAAAACATACSSTVAHAAANAASYGHERRFPLRAPAPVVAGPLPLAALLVAAGIATGPLLVASGTIIGGIGLTAAGLVLAAFLGRSLHGLARRWVVLVPAGLVVADPLTLADPVLVPRETVASADRIRITQAPAGALDLRLGTALGSVEVRLRDPATFAHRRGHDAETVQCDVFLVAPLRPAALVAAARDHGIAC